MDDCGRTWHFQVVVLGRVRSGALGGVLVLLAPRVLLANGDRRLACGVPSYPSREQPERGSTGREQGGPTRVADLSYPFALY